MKIAIVFSHLPEKYEAKDTYERALRERFIIEKLNQDGHDARIMFLGYGNKIEILDDIPKAVFYPVDNKTIPKGRKFFTSELLGKGLKKFSPDIVLFKGMGYILPWNLYKNGFLPDHFGFIVGGNTSDIMLPLSSLMFIEFPNQQQLFKSVSTIILGKYIPDSDFREKKGPSEYDIVSVGDFSHRKNQRALVPLFDKYRILFVGDGSEFVNVKKMVRAGNHVTFAGKVEKQEVVDNISKARIMVHPSRSEGFPRVFSEAFACGIPVLALKRAIGGDFPHKKAGELVEECDLVGRASDLLSDETALNRYSVEARRIAENSYRGNMVYSQFLSGIESVLNRSQKKRSLKQNKFILYFRVLFWILDFYFYHFGRPVKKFLKSMLRR